MKFTRASDLMLFGNRPDESTWRGVKLLLFVYLGSLLFAAVATGPVYAWVTGPVFAGMHELKEVFPWQGWDYLTKDRSFDKYFDRLRMLPVLVGLPWLLVVCGLCSIDKLKEIFKRPSKLPSIFRYIGLFGVSLLYALRRLGVNFSRAHRLQFARWFGIAAVMLGAVIVAQLSCANVSLREGITWLDGITGLLVALLIGCVVGLLEETVFRGLIFRIFHTAVRPLPAMVLSALFFAYVHFKVPDMAKDMLMHADQWWMGLYVAFWMLVGIAFDFAWIEFLNLFVFGLLLCCIFLRTRSLMASIGLHAGGVWAIKFYNDIFAVHGHAAQWLWGGGKVIDGLLPLGIMSAVCIYLVVTHPEHAHTEP